MMKHNMINNETTWLRKKPKKWRISQVTFVWW